MCLYVSRIIDWGQQTVVNLCPDGDGSWILWTNHWSADQLSTCSAYLSGPHILIIVVCLLVCWKKRFRLRWNFLFHSHGVVEDEKWNQTVDIGLCCAVVTSWLHGGGRGGETKTICRYARVNQFYRNQNCSVHLNIAKSTNITISKPGNFHTICKLWNEEMHKRKAWGRGCASPVIGIFHVRNYSTDTDATLDLGIILKVVGRIALICVLCSARETEAEIYRFL